MRVPGASDILALTDRGAGLGPARRALLLLEAAWPDRSREAIAATPLSARDRALLALRAQLFGRVLAARCTCACGELLELELTAEALGLAPLGDPFPPAPSERLGADGPVIRAVTAGDAAAAEAAGDAEAACALIAQRAAPGAEHEPGLDATLEALDPGAEVEIALTCPACDTVTARAFDAPAFVWREIEASAPRILREVAELARAYHWSERDILAMPARRRAFYLAEARA